MLINTRLVHAFSEKNSLKLVTTQLRYDLDIHRRMQWLIKRFRTRNAEIQRVHVFIGSQMSPTRQHKIYGQGKSSFSTLFNPSVS